MPIPFYNLHDRTAEDLVAEMIRLIPAHTPEWRNPRPGDPGRVLIDLFAWMGDKLLYRVNLLPERQRLMFLALLDIGLTPAVPARGLLALSHAAPKDLVRVDLPGLSLVPGPLAFETTDAATILAVSGACYLKRRPTQAEADSVADLTEGLRSVYELAETQSYVTTPVFAGARAGAGVDVARDTVDQTLWIAFLAREAPADLAAFRAAVFGRTGAGPILLNVGLAPQAEVATADLQIDAPRPRPELWQWQVAAPRVRPDGAPEYNTLAPAISDSTAGFTRPGVLRLVLPDAGEIGLPQNDPDQDVMAGVGDRPPRIDDPAIAARLVGWLRLRPKTRVETLPLAWAGINMVEVDQRQTLRNIVVGQATGGPDLALQLPATSIDPGSLVVEVQRADGQFEPWGAVADLAAQGRDAPAYRLDPEAGVIRFGDGVRGRVPPAGARVRVSLRHGGGRAGNLAPGSLATIAHPRLVATQPLALTGGEDAETLAAAERRIPARLRHADRAVTAQDFRDLAVETPGTDLARVEVLERFRPFQRLSDVPGVVSVMVVPRPGQLAAPHPRPDRGILTAVHDHLDARRLMGTELYVIGPEYRELGVSASVRLRPGTAPDRALAEVETALRAALGPTAPGGRDGTGWPLGGTVTNLELEVVAARIASVEAVYGVQLFTRSESGAWALVPRAANGQASVTLESWMLPELTDLVLAQDPGGAPTSLTGGTGGGATGAPIPIVPELC